MGFFDTLSGLGRSLGGLATAAIQTLGPPLLGVGAQVLAQKALGKRGGGYYGGNIALPGGAPAYSPYTPPFNPNVGRSPYSSPPIWSPAPQGPATTYQRPTYQSASYSPGGMPVPSFPDYRYSPSQFSPAIFQPAAVGGGLFGIPGLDIPGIDLAVPESQTFGSGLFRAAAPTARPRSLIMAMNPITGAPTFFKHVGRPVLFSGDFGACRRVNKLASRARGGRRRFR